MVEFQYPRSVGVHYLGAVRYFNMVLASDTSKGSGPEFWGDTDIADSTPHHILRRQVKSWSALVLVYPHAYTYLNVHMRTLYVVRYGMQVNIIHI